MKDQGFFKPARETLARVWWPEAIMRIPWKMDIHSNVCVFRVQHKRDATKHLLRVRYPTSLCLSLISKTVEHEDRQNSVNNCKGLCVFRCDNFLPTFRFSSNAKPLNSKFDVLMKMFLFLAVSYMYTLCKSFAKNPSSKICVIIIHS